MPIPEIATALGVAHVVEGSVRRAGDRLRITAQLIRAHDGFHLWSETYERSNADSFGVQGEIAARIASALDVILDDAQLERMRNSGMRNPEAFIAYQKAVELNANAHDESGQARLDGLEEANVFYDRVLELEPNTPAAYFDRADYYIHFAVEADERESRPEDMPAAIESAKRDLQNAIRNSRTEGDRLTATLEYALIAEEWRRLPELFRSAVQSTDCFVPSWWAGLGGFFEPLDGTLTLWQRAQTCDPLSYYNWGNIVLIQTTLGAYDDALATATRAMQVVPHRLTAEKLIMAHVGLGDFDAAEAANERLIEDPALRTMHRLRIAAAKGDVETAQKLNDALAGRPNGYSATLSTLAMLGERDLANALAAELDARALGYVRLLDESGSCLCGAPFDLEFTPNFARLIEEAELQWPPRSPIEWPLKDW